MKYFKKLVGERIYLSPMNMNDSEIFVKWMNDFYVTDYIRKSAGIVTLESEKEWLENTLRKEEANFSIIKLLRIKTSKQKQTYYIRRKLKCVVV